MQKTYLDYTSNDIETVIVERDSGTDRDIREIARIKGDNHEQLANDYLEYVGGKIEIEEEPLTFEQWNELNSL
jgi:hypothetical protein